MKIIQAHPNSFAKHKEETIKGKEEIPIVAPTQSQLQWIDTSRLLVIPSFFQTNT